MNLFKVECTGYKINRLLKYYSRNDHRQIGLLCIHRYTVIWVSMHGGGWTLVWQHTYMKYKLLHPKMFYYSKSYQPCVKNASHEKWCNIPNKARFNPTEQMIVAYHKGTIVYAYKSYFSYNIDYQWNGAILVNAKKVIDKCTKMNGTPPAPSIHVSRIFAWSQLL